jgi:hypothetical protein
VTRINAVPVAALHRVHLVAEYRENPRVFGLVWAAQRRGLTPDTVRSPPLYVLGTGHVKFFYSRLGFVLARQHQLVAEMRARLYAVNHGDPDSLRVGLDDHWFGEWEPDETAIALSRSRLEQRLRDAGHLT